MPESKPAIFPTLIAITRYREPNSNLESPKYSAVTSIILVRRHFWVRNAPKVMARTSGSRVQPQQTRDDPTNYQNPRYARG